MLRSMNDAVAGLQVHQQWMDVIGNNIANVSTPGFKASDVNFQQLFAQTLNSGGQPQGAQGGTNPTQIGLGVGVGSITRDLTQGTPQQTGSPTDLAIDGDGYFILDLNGQGSGYTRVGNFQLDSAGNMVLGNTGFKVKGWLANAGGTLPTQSPATLTDIVIPPASSKAPQATANAAFDGNLSAGATSPVAVPFPVYDSLGNVQQLTVTFTPSGTADQWNWTVTGPASSGIPTGAAAPSGTLAFTSAGAYNAAGFSMTHPLTLSPTDGAAGSQAIAPDFSALTQYSSSTQVTPGTQDGYAAGSLEQLSVDKSGTITGAYTNGLHQVLGQVAVATFPNPQALQQQGQGIYTLGNNSGPPDPVVAGTGGAGSIDSGALEGSNVDLAKEFTEMIAAERGFQANAKVVTTADQMLQTLVQI